MEHEAWSQLGPFIGPFLAVGTRWQPFVLHTRIAAETILQRGLDSTATTHVAPKTVREPSPETHAEELQPPDADESVPGEPTSSDGPVPLSENDFPWQHAA